MKKLGFNFRWQVVPYAVVFCLIVIPLSSEFPDEVRWGGRIIGIIGLIVYEYARFRLRKLERELKELELKNDENEHPVV